MIQPKARTPLGAMLAAHKRRSGLSYREVAERAGVCRSYPVKLVTEGKTPSRDVVVRLARALGLDEAETDQLLLAAGYAVEDIASVLREPNLVRFNHLIGLVSDETAERMRGLLNEAIEIGSKELAA